ncbi:MAG: SEL1-like repeat protein, partial [Verrucomicrobia bacterium]|nr:SEL1-like repeat protein [Verrucomicrobiota bacterium]
RRLPVQLLTPPPTPVQLVTPEPTPVVTFTPTQLSTPIQTPENTPSPTPVLTPTPAESVTATPQPSPTQIAMLSPTPPLVDRYHDLLSRAQTEEVNNDWRTALKTYLYVMDEFPGRPGGGKRLDNLISGLRSPGRGISAEALADARPDFEAAANQGSVPAMLILAEQLRSTDKPAALKWYEAAAEKDNVTGMVQAGILYAAEHDPDALHKAVNYFIQAGDKGDRMGKYLAGECYYYGKGVPADTKKAVGLLQESAALGEPRAMDLLGTYYRKIVHQYDQARHYFEEAAGLGYATSISNLGVMYMNAEGVPKNPQTGASYFRQAAEKGDGAGMFFYAECLHAGLGVPKNQKEAADWYRRSARIGFGPAVGWCKQNNVEY